MGRKSPSQLFFQAPSKSAKSAAGNYEDFGGGPLSRVDMSTASGSAWKQLADTKSAIGSSMRSMSRPGIAADDKSETSSAAPSRHGTGATGSVAALSRVRSKQGSGSHAQSLALMQSTPPLTILAAAPPCKK